MLKASRPTAARPKRVRGFTLTEIAVVMGVIGVIVTGIWMAAARVQDQNAVKQTVDQIMMAEANFRALYATKNGITDPSGTNVGQFAGTDLFPQSAVCPAGMGNWACNLWGDMWRVMVGRGSDTGGGPPSMDTTHFYIYSGRVPIQLCAQMVKKLTQSDATAILINNGGGWLGGWVAPNTITDANAICWPFGAGTDTAVGVEFLVK